MLSLTEAPWGFQALLFFITRPGCLELMLPPGVTEAVRVVTGKSSSALLEKKLVIAYEQA